MTVGIAAVCENGGDLHVVLAADRMVTTGYTTRVEYEHTNSKIEPLIETSAVSAAAVSSGSLSYADDMFLRIGDELIDDPPQTVEDVAKEAVDAYHELQKETFNNQILNPIGLSLQDFRQGDTNLTPQVQKSILNAVFESKKELAREIDLLIAGVDEDGGHIYSINDGDMTIHDSFGYLATGSGSWSALLAFIRNQYDVDCSITDCILAVVEAKVRAEEAQGVGKEMDILVLDERHAEGNDLSDQSEDLVKLHGKIKKAEEKARERAITKSGYRYKRE